MGTVYFPRLQASAAQEMLGRYSALPVLGLAELASLESVHADWYATAPATSRVSEKTLREFQSVVRSIAAEYGFPSTPVTARRRRGDFDRTLAGAILDAAPMLPAEAAQQAVWSFMTLVVVPDVAFWRWRSDAGEFDFQRILGYPRNAYRRLWWRSYILGGGADGPATLLQEDEAVAIMERTSIAGNRRLAGAIARAHLELHAGRPRREDILRDAMKRLRRLHAFTSFHSLTDGELAALVRECLLEAASSIQDRPPKKKKGK